MKALKSLLTVSAIVAAGSANAALYDLVGTSETTLDINGASIASVSAVGSGDVDTTGGIFNSASFAYTSTVTSAADAGLLSTVTGTLDIDSAGNVTDTITGCSDSGTTLSCPSVTVGSFTTTALTTFDVADLSSLTFEWFVYAQVAALGYLDSTQAYSYTATPVASAVPVPAAAWLFGSAVLGLCGVGRARSA